MAAARGRVRARRCWSGACRRSASASADSCWRRRRGAHVGPSPEPEFGFTRVELSDGAADDPLFGALPREFDVWNAHGYAFHVPEDGVELARSPVCAQAFRLGDSAWGVQFHPEIRVDQVAHWLSEDRVPNANELLEELRGRYEEWRSFGAGLLRSFLAAASKAPARSG